MCTKFGQADSCHLCMGTENGSFRGPMPHTNVHLSGDQKLALAPRNLWLLAIISTLSFTH